MNEKVEELVKRVAIWVLDGGCPCISCKPTGGENLECEETPEKPAKICSALRSDICKLLSHPDLALIDREKELPENPYLPRFYDLGRGWEKGANDVVESGYLPVIPLAEAKEVK